MQIERSAYRLVSNTKIEDRAISALSDIVNDHQTMLCQFNSMDKEMSWDGYIWIYKKQNGKQDKENFDDKVPVQIKGHVDRDKKYINKTGITYSVSIADLRVYFRDRGVMYFEIFMSEDGKKKEIFYNSLFPTKLKYYLEQAEKRKNKEFINIPFTKLEKQADIFYCIIKQFSNESKKQGFGHEQLVQNAIKRADMSKIKTITASVVGAKNEIDFLKRFNSGDVSFYTKVDGTSFVIPIEWEGGKINFIMKKIEQPLGVGGCIYYESYRIQLGASGERIIYPSDNLKIDMSEYRFTFKPKTDLKIIKNDAKFLLALLENNQIEIGECKFPYTNLKIPKEACEDLKFYIEIEEMLSKIGVEYLRPFNEIPEELMRQFVRLISLKKNEPGNSLIESAESFKLVMDEKYVPIVIFKNDIGGENDIVNAIYTDKYEVFMEGQNGKQYQIPKFAHLDGNMMKKLYKYDIESFEKQIADADINDETEEMMNKAGLNLIHAYDNDARHDQNFLRIAEKLFKDLSDRFGEKNIYTINRMQIKKRLGILEKEGINFLIKMKCENNMENFGREVLLENKIEAKKIYEQMSESEQREMKDYPIYNLYSA